MRKTHLLKLVLYTSIKQQLISGLPSPNPTNGLQAFKFKFFKVTCSHYCSQIQSVHACEVKTSVSGLNLTTIETKMQACKPLIGLNLITSK